MGACAENAARAAPAGIERRPGHGERQQQPGARRHGGQGQEEGGDRQVARIAHSQGPCGIRGPSQASGHQHDPAVLHGIEKQKLVLVLLLFLLSELLVDAPLFVFLG